MKTAVAPLIVHAPEIAGERLGSGEFGESGPEKVTVIGDVDATLTAPGAGTTEVTDRGGAGVFELLVCSALVAAEEVVGRPPARATGCDRSRIIPMTRPITSATTTANATLARRLAHQVRAITCSFFSGQDLHHRRLGGKSRRGQPCVSQLL